MNVKIKRKSACSFKKKSVLINRNSKYTEYLDVNNEKLNIHFDENLIKNNSEIINEQNLNEIKEHIVKFNSDNNEEIMELKFDNSYK